MSAVNCHPHPLHPIQSTAPWNCDGRKLPGGCKRGITDFNQTLAIQRFRCESCDFDLCDLCFQHYSVGYGELDKNEEAELDRELANIQTREELENYLQTSPFTDEEKQQVRNEWDANAMGNRERGTKKWVLGGAAGGYVLKKLMRKYRRPHHVPQQYGTPAHYGHAPQKDPHKKKPLQGLLGLIR
eukprot:NODE_7836_length_736_cov_144.752039_g7222_i0.p1 GENE.NODE_7836_length_736_cov_144.752039_g7222_i0~~NODE_7836_length_736_cov_144.752039_g7222_i0.p1  ORF type:complete len:185 (-),score=26.71 NODE_7836_length_736_cov_144.752039_g7222_i0:112-666(-)